MEGVTSQTFEEALALFQIPVPPFSVPNKNFTRWGKNNRYWARAVNEGYIFGDFTEDISTSWFPQTQALQRSKALIKKALAELEEERKERQSRVAEEALRRWELAQSALSHPYLSTKQIEPCGVKIEADQLLIPLYDAQGKLWSLQTINAQGQKRFLAEGRKKNCFFPIGSLEESETLCICEGFATGASIHMALQQSVVVAFDAGNLEAVTQALRCAYPTARLIICADNDQWGGTNTGKDTAQRVCQRYNISMVCPLFKDSTTRPTDFNDLHVLEGIEAVKQQIGQAITVHSAPILPPGFILKKEGLYFDASKETGPEWVCSSIEVLACTRDEKSEHWGRLICFSDQDGSMHKFSIPMEALSGDYTALYSQLLSSGLHLSTKKSVRNKLPEYLQGVKVGKRALCTARIGWHNDHFILPNETIPFTDSVCLQNHSTYLKGFGQSGTLEEWQNEVASYCQGNSRLVLALSCAFAPPLLPLINMESGGIHLRGSSSIGKSTALLVAASVWGNDEYIQTWRATGNALEALAESRNHALLCLDELGQVDGKEAGQISYMLANGAGKNRLKSTGELKRRYEWKLLFLSTGEISLEDKMNEEGRMPHAGMMARMIDVPADAGKGHGLFDTLHSFKDGHALAVHLKEATSQHHGKPIRAFLQALSAHKQIIGQRIKELMKDFITDNVDPGADGQVKRVASRFAFIAAAGELVIAMNILPFEEGEAIKATQACFKAWLEERGTSTQSYEETKAIEQVHNFLETHHASRFETIDTGFNSINIESKISHHAGYKRKRIEDTEEYYEFLIFPTVFRKEMCKGFDPKMVCHILEKRGSMNCDKDGRFDKVQRTPLGTKRVYCLSSTLLNGEPQ